MRRFRTALLGAAFFGMGIGQANAQPAPPPAPPPSPEKSAAPAAPPADKPAPAQPLMVSAQIVPPAPAAAPAPAPVGDVPPKAPPPGARSPMPEPPPGPPPVFPLEPEVKAAVRDSGPPLAGYHGAFYLRDPNDNFRFYPRGRLHLDFHSFFGRGVHGEHGIKAEDGGNALKNRLFLRRARFELAGELFSSWSFNMAVETGGQPLSNANGRAETAAGPVGEDPSANSARFAPVQAVSSAAVLADNYINYSFCKCLNFMFGQYNAPISMENRSSNIVISWQERNLAIRGFVFPTNKELGVTAWGELGERNLMYEFAVLAGDGQNRAQVDNSFDFAGRIFARPFAKAGKKHPLEKAHIGMSALWGNRDQAFVGYTYPAITSGQGFSLWDPRYTDSQGHLTYVIPSGSQRLIGGEFRLPISIFEVRGEGYYVANDTREALDGRQLVNTERLGRVKGAGWYAEFSAWPLGDAFVNGDIGFFRPTHVDFNKELPKPKKGVQVMAIIAGVHADYQGAARGGTPDLKTPGTNGIPSNITVMQYGIGANYWHTRHFRAALNFIAYQTPGSGSPKENVRTNLAVVPGNLSKDAATAVGVHFLYELSARISTQF